MAVHCRDLAVGYGSDIVLDELTLTIEAGTTLAVVGQSGCGKTTLLKTLAGILPPIAGEVDVLDTSLPAAPPGGELGYIPQGLGLVPHENVMRNVLHGRLSELGRFRSLLGRFPAHVENDARNAIERVGLAEKTYVRVSELSGGQRRRVAIARSFVHEPRLLLADEMLSELDTGTKRTIINCLTDLQAATGMTVILVEHNETVVQEIADRVLAVDANDPTPRAQ